MPLVEQELLTLPKHLSSPSIFSGVCVTRSLFYVYVLQIVVWHLVLFLLSIVLSVLLRLTDSDYPFGIFKLFFIVSLTISPNSFQLQFFLRTLYISDLSGVSIFIHRGTMYTYIFSLDRKQAFCMHVQMLMKYNGEHKPKTVKLGFNFIQLETIYQSENYVRYDIHQVI